ncbi:PAS domain S-box protein [Rhabdochromatium marinum]|uniref:PAS domain S-box protein n=1 Tax=Rhabdochromatium marinum TaxID=48729 RepID=UPI001904CDAC|nr:PAS domain S-box protein [Rhabdochromatium marinum]MBK1647223.1 hypothetical protein [Rhabdochromatium marinum]
MRRPENRFNPGSVAEAEAPLAYPLRIAILVGLILLTLAIAATAYQWLMRQARQQAETRLQQINTSLVEDFSLWRQTQLEAAATLARDPLLARAFLAVRAGNPKARADLAVWARSQRNRHSWSDVRFFTPDLQPIPGLAWPGTEPEIPIPSKAVMEQVVQSRQVQLTEIYPYSAEGQGLQQTRQDALHIAVMLPLSNPESPGQLIGLLVLGQRPHRTLFPLLGKHSLYDIGGKSWLIDTSTEHPRLLAGPHPLHNALSGAAEQTFGADLSGHSALRATVFMLELTDWGGRHAFAVAANVPGSHWLLVTEAPVDRLLGSTYRTLLILSVMILAVISTLIAANHLLTLRHRNQEYLRRYQGERERRKLLEALRESDSQLDIFFNDAFSGMGVATHSLQWQRINPALAELIGCQPHALCGQPCRELFFPEDRAAVMEAFEQLRHDKRKVSRQEVRLLRADGSALPVRLALHAIRQADASLKHLLIQVDDMRDRQEAEQLYDVLLNTCMDGFWILDLSGRLLGVNQGYCRLTGYAREELIGQPITAVEVYEDQSLVDARIARMIIQGGSEYFETAHRCKDGSLAYLEISASFSHLQGGRLYAFLRDITERKGFQQALEQERAQLRTLFDGIDAIIYVSDLDTYELIYANDSFVQPGVRDFSGQRCHQFMHGHDSPCAFCNKPSLRLHDAGNSHVWQFHDSHTGRWYRCADKLLNWWDGRRVRFEIASDITAQKNHDQQVLQLEKLSSLGQLTAGLAHELNNPLMGVINGIQFCIEEHLSDEERRGVLRDAEQQTRRCINIVRELLAFSRQRGVDMHVFCEIDPQPIIARVLRLFDYRLTKAGIQLDVNCDPQLQRLRLQPERFEQVVTNLVGNAVDAVAGSPERRISLRLSRQDGQVALEISDTGPGVPKEIQQRVFEPFFTTKPTGQGTGLGLSTSWSIITDHGGTLDFASLEGQGTRVTARLPDTSPQPAPTAIQPPHPTSSA